ncbi:hypothetical protein [Micromonospora sp. CPCC 205561]|uniref:hypothetical protein n=1 Tax=Micromonospora sp. CPCC 205561 TaxID=3122407 RepID=UPI002FF02BF0
MAFRTWGRLLLTALAVSLLAGAGQLGVAFGLGIVRLTGSFTGATVNQWPAQLVWVGWFAANAAVLGAVLTERLARRGDGLAGTGRLLAVAGAAALGATVVAPLCMQPARAAELVSVDPVWAVGICAVLGALAGAGAALAVLLQPPVGWNMAAVAGAVWLLALVSVAPTLVSTGPLPSVRLGVLEPSWLAAGAAQRLALVVLPLVALLAGAATGGLARWRGQPPLVSGATGVAGPVLVAFAYLTAGPGDTADRYQLTPYYAALLAVAAGALGSAAAALLRWPLGTRTAPTGAIEPTDILRPLPAGPVRPQRAAPAADGEEPETLDLAGADLAATGRAGRERAADVGSGGLVATGDTPPHRAVPPHWDWPAHGGTAPAADAPPVGNSQRVAASPAPGTAATTGRPDEPSPAAADDVTDARTPTAPAATPTSAGPAATPAPAGEDPPARRATPDGDATRIGRAARAEGAAPAQVGAPTQSAAPAEVAAPAHSGTPAEVETPAQHVAPTGAPEARPVAAEDPAVAVAPAEEASADERSTGRVARVGQPTEPAARVEPPADGAATVRQPARKAAPVGRPAEKAASTEQPADAAPPAEPSAAPGAPKPRRPRKARSTRASAAVPPAGTDATPDADVPVSEAAAPAAKPSPTAPDAPARPDAPRGAAPDAPAGGAAAEALVPAPPPGPAAHPEPVPPVGPAGLFATTTGAEPAPLWPVPTRVRPDAAEATPVAESAPEQAPRPRHRAPMPDLARAANWDALATARRAGPVPAPAPADGTPAEETPATAPAADPASPAEAEPATGRSRIRLGLFRRNRSRTEDAPADRDAAEALPEQDEEYVDWVTGLSRPVPDNEPEQESGRRSLRSTGRHHRD